MKRGLMTALVGGIAVIASLSRLLVANSDALNTVLFAEDGLFPLCVRKVSVASCLVDPYAGYLLFIPRILAPVVAWFPLEAWAVVANFVAALVSGVLAALAFAVVRRNGIPVAVAAVIAVLPVAVPLAGFEAVNVTASVYIPLTYLMALALSLPGPRPAAKWLTIGTAVTALTIPTAVVLVIPIVGQAMKGGLGRRQSVLITGGLAAGLSVQFAVVLSASLGHPRVSLEDGLRTWLDALPNAILSNWPGLSFGPAPMFDYFEISPWLATTWVTAVAILFLGLWLTIKGRGLSLGAGLLILLGLALSAFPSILNGATNRYYVASVAAWIAALLVLIAEHVQRRRTLVLVVVVLGIVALWRPAWAASEFRAHASPDWQVEVARVRAACATDPGKEVEFHFTPDWPFPQSHLAEPTTNRALCFKLR